MENADFHIARGAELFKLPDAKEPVGILYEEVAGLFAAKGAVPHGEKRNRAFHVIDANHAGLSAPV